ncbi:MAG TPA: CehA/McbA family metallohydrolase, partial [Thermoleophilaceae bacterium]|nr:CehA/McbA family metallohydrolase [Thermoleophilaceae bacterium]
MGRRALAAVAIAVIGLVAPAAARAAPPSSCGLPGPDQATTGGFDAARQGSFVFVPFDVPAGTTQVRVAYCWDGSQGTSDHTLDLGVYQARGDTRRPWGGADFRGWGGSGYRDVTITPQGFSSDAQYQADPKAYTPGRTTRSFVPGPIPAGRWAAELGLANIDPTDLDGVAYRVEVKYYRDRAFAATPYRRPRHDPAPVRAGTAWYAGDFHVHAEHSGDARASFAKTLGYAFRPRPAGGPGLDFVAVTDHNTGTGWPEEDRLRGEYPGRLILRGEEVTTYNGHTNNIAGGVEPDYRTGPLYERQGDGSLRLVRAAQPVSGVFDTVNRAGGITQINHPTLFPSPPFPSNLCRGCQWTHSDAATDYSKVDSIEVATGPQRVSAAPNPFVATAIGFWDDKLRRGHHIAAVGGSDDHRASGGTGPTDAPVGQPTTMVRACGLSEQSVRQAVEAGRTYVKVGGPGAPDLDLTGRIRGTRGPEAIIGDTIHSAAPVDFRATVRGAAGVSVLQVVKDGNVIRAVPLSGPAATVDFDSTGPGYYRLQVNEGQFVSAVSSPIYVVGQAGPPPSGGACPPARTRLRA